MAFGDFLFGKKERMQQYPTQTTQGMDYLNNLLKMSQTGLNNPYAGFEPIENRARSQFQQSLPSLAERFASMGTGAQRSSGFQSAIGRAQAGLEESLASLRSQYGLQNRGQMLQMGQLGLSPQFENVFRPATGGFLGELAGPLSRLGLGLGMNYGVEHGAFGRNMMNQYNNKGLGSLLPLLMML